MTSTHPKDLSKEYRHIFGERSPDEINFDQAIENIIHYYENIIGCMPGNVYWLDKNGLTLGCNKNVLDMFGFTSVKEFKGLSFEDMGQIAHWSKKAEQSFKKDTLDVIKTGRAKLNVEEPPIPHHDGRVIYFLTSRVPLFNQTGEVMGVVGISIDITERKKMEENLLKAKQAAEVANKIKTEFLENMRHDIRTPLTGILGFASAIKEEAHAPQKIHEYADNLIASSQALFDLLTEVLEAIKVASGEISIVQKKFNLEEKLQTVIELNQSKAKQKKLDLALYHDKTIPTYLMGDPKRIHRIVLELVTNALNFTHEGHVKVFTELAKRHHRETIIKIKVEDTGIGIPPDQQEEIFVQFKRLTPSHQGLYKGRGLGLSIVKQFINDLSGEIYVESERRKGTTFTCIVPLKEALLEESFGADKTSFGLPTIRLAESPSKIPTTVTPSLSAATLTQTRILVVEDNRLAAQATQCLLASLRCSVDVAIDGHSAIECAKTGNYDLLFMDVGLPDMNGNEVTQEIRRWEALLEKHIPIVGLTAHVDTDNKQQCIEAGMDAVLSKPLLKETANEILNAFIPKHRTALEPAKSPTKQSQTNGLFDLPEKTIDLQLGEQLMRGNKEQAKEMLKLLLISLSEELPSLQKAFGLQDWKTIHNIAHKLHGGACYCGVPRLKLACHNLETYLKQGETELQDALYQQMLAEIEAVKEKLASETSQ